MSALLEVKNLKVYFPVKPGMFSRAREFVKAVDDVSFSIAPGETLGLVGESGCGKTTLGRAIVRLVEPTAGEISLDGENILTDERLGIARAAAEVPDDFPGPYGSLNPRMTVEQIVGEALDIHKLTDSSSARQKEFLNCSRMSASTRFTRSVIRMNFPAVNVNASASRARWRSSRN